jgi:pyrroline-5-carboxylate reductase
VENTKLTFIGAGNMARSIIGGLINNGHNASAICASDPLAENLHSLTNLGPVATTSDNNSAVRNAEVVILAVKPQILKMVATALAPSLRENKPLVISIAAGIELNSLENWLGEDIPIVRCMPNTPALVQLGATGLFANPLVSDIQRDTADKILSSIGIARWVDQESALHAVTAVSGSGPAYFFLVMEAIQEAGIQLGLDPELSKTLTLQTALGAVQMAVVADVELAELRQGVTSPGGTTEQAIKSFEDGNLRELFMRALASCENRSRELAEQLGKD